MTSRDFAYWLQGFFEVSNAETITKEQAEAKIKAAGLPPETLVAVTPKNSPAYAAAQASINQTATGPSNIPPAETQQPSQSGGGNSTSAEVTASVPGPAPAPVAPIVLQTGYTANVTGKEIALATNEKNLAGREANQQQLLDNANSFSRSEQQRLDAEAAAAAARGDPDAAAKQAEAEQYANARRNATDAASRNQTLIEADKQLIIQQEAEVAQARAQAAANPVPPGYVVATAGDDPANNPPPPVDQTETPASFSAAPVDTPLLTPAESIARAQTTAPADVEPANTGVFANPNFSPEAISGTPPPVDPATDPGVKSPFGGAASNAAAARNPEAAAAALQQEQANQAAAM